jgi:PPOX class probable F420-dependent enzyme
MPRIMAHRSGQDGGMDLPDDVRAFLSQPNPAVIATVGKHGPVSVATWYLLEDDGRVLVNMDDTRKRLEHLARDPHVSLTALEEGNWYTHVSLQGRVVEIRSDEGLADIDRLSVHYGGNPYPDRTSPRTSAWIEVDRIHGWGAQKSAST